ncbi:MAG: hypothetical protein CL666_16145 [Balneola sp.]|nr:hypothetical protein [Balneola sp.]|tara:strand:+ start:714 stop:1448 length:735 start_codon:yes stop_codon:yes gene_type:complete
MLKSYPLIWSLVLFALLPFNANAQMFSVDDENEKQGNPFAPYIRVGIQPVDFEFTGDPAAFSVQNQTDLSFKGTVAQAGFESGGFNLDVLVGNNLTDIDNRKFFGLEIKFTNPFYLIRQERFGLGVPLQVGTKLTSVRSDDVQSEFSQTNLYAAAGITSLLYFPEKFSITGSFMPAYGFSTASGGFVGGNVFSLKGKARINFFNVIFGRNISLGYDYIYDSYNVDGEEFDYDLNGHSITLGVSL